MSKVLNVENGNYIIKIEPGKNIILDTSRGQVNDENELIGKVIINGQLDVKGTTTSIESTDLQISDNIIVLNKYEDGTGVSTVLDGTSGIEIDRGLNGARVRMVWDEAITWDLGGDSGQGTFKFENAGYGIIPIHTSGIKSPGTFYFDVGNEVISVQNSLNYEQKVFSYSGGVVYQNGNDGVVDDDAIPNARAVADYIKFAFEELGSGNKLEMYDTNIIVYDFEFDGDPSRIEFTVDGVLKVTIDENYVTLPGIQIDGAHIYPRNASADLELSATGAGSIVVDSVLRIKEILPGNEPMEPTEGVKLFSKAPDTGDTGIYYINKDTTQDELISNNRSLVYSMIF